MNSRVNYSMLVWLMMLAIPSGLFQMFSVGALSYLAFLLLLLAWSFTSKFLTKRTLSRPILLIGLLAIFYILSAWMNGRLWNSAGTYDTAILLISMTVYFILSRHLILTAPNIIQWANRALSIVIVGLTITALIGLMQWMGLIPELSAIPGIGMAWHKNHYGYMCAVALVIVTVRANSNYWSLRVSAALIIILMTCLVISLARGAWAVGFFGLVLVQFAYRKQNFMKMLLGFCIVGLILSLTTVEVTQRFEQEDVSTGRFALWLVLFPQSWDNFIYGKGTGYMWSLNQFDISQYGGYISDYNESIYAHNDFLFLLVELGIFGALLWCGTLYLLAKNALRLIRTVHCTDSVYEFGVILLFTVVSLIVTQMTDTIFFGARNVYLALGLLAISSSVVDYRLALKRGTRK